MKDFFDRHEKVGLLFSGGKDSLTCLYKCKPYWDKLVVLWANTGKNFPEVVEFIEQVRKMVPHFLEVKSDQDGFVKTFGYPAEVVTARFTPEGLPYNTRKPRQQVVNKYQCCAYNLWRPIEEAMVKSGCTGFVKGQRGDDPCNDSWVDKFELQGRQCEMFYPCRDLKESDCLEYLKSQGVDLSERFFIGRSSLDCWDCTGYWEYLPKRLAYMKKHHPEKHEYVVRVLKNIKADVEDDISLLNLGDLHD